MSPPETEHDVECMRRALELAVLADGATSPNPIVGAVLVKGGRVIGEGYHRRAGAPHAEIEAIRAADTEVAGATLYVTLEPCCTHGRTPPCSDAIVAAKIARVIYATTDQNPRVSGRGHSALEDAGTAVSKGILEAEARFSNRHFFHHVKSGRPYVTVRSGNDPCGPQPAADAVIDACGELRWAGSKPLRVACEGVDFREALGSLGREGIVRLTVDANAPQFDELQRAGLIDEVWSTTPCFEQERARLAALRFKAFARIERDVGTLLKACLVLDETAQLLGSSSEVTRT
jgi:pyrimidine deaminase RibD-like protein